MATGSKSQAPLKPQPSSAKPQGYTVLARRYRSRDFDQIIGQEPIALTLQNAIKTNRTAHAYLFSGTRGVGKTSMARIFAKALNATDDLQEKDAIAEAILRGDDLDVIEIDGASYRGINEARELIAGAGLSPARSPYKIYIIDEVHQLTKDAFNALLKTMEEPPAHVKFILCTTEPHKVPATIQSRCQRFDFRTIPASKIAGQLKQILQAEGISAADEVIAQVARLGNGSMRDALSILDRLLSAGEQALTMDVLEQMLGLPDHALVVELVEAIMASDPAAALEGGAQLLARGATVEQALEMLAEHFRTLMVIAACGEQSEFLDLSEESRRSAAGQASHFDAAALVHMIAICDAVARSARTSAAARALFDAALVRMALSHHFADIAGLLAGKVPAAPAPGPPAAAADRKKKETRQDQIASRPSLESPPVLPSREGITAPGPSRITEIKQVADDQLWPRVLEVAAASMGDRMRTEHLVFESFDGRTLRLSINESGADIARYLGREIDRLVDLVQRATGQTVRIELDASRAENSAKPPAIPCDIDAARSSPLVAKAIELFEADVISVQPRSGSPRQPDRANLGSPDV